MRHIERTPYVEFESIHEEGALDVFLRHGRRCIRLDRGILRIVSQKNAFALTTAVGLDNDKFPRILPVGSTGSLQNIENRNARQDRMDAIVHTQTFSHRRL